MSIPYVGVMASVLERAKSSASELHQLIEPHYSVGTGEVT